MKKVPVKVTYGVMTALELALHYGSLPVQAKVIAQRQSIPARFIEQVLQALKQAGVVNSLRGAQGGYSLSKAPEEISLGEVVEAMNGRHEPSVRHLSTNGHGDRPVHQEKLLTTIWDRIHQSEREILSSITLQSLVERYSLLEQEQAPMYHI